MGRETTEPSVLGSLPRQSHQAHRPPACFHQCQIHISYALTFSSLLGEVKVRALSHTTVKVGTQQPESGSQEATRSYGG